jgi:hypothetical protein
MRELAVLLPSAAPKQHHAQLRLIGCKVSA